MKRFASMLILLALTASGCSLKLPALAPGADPSSGAHSPGKPAANTTAARDSFDFTAEGPQAPPVHDDRPFTAQEEMALKSDTDLPLELDDQDTEEVQVHFRYFTHSTSGRKLFETWLKRSESYMPYIRKVLANRGLPPDLAFLPFVESGFNPKVISRAGAAGVWQFMPGTGRLYGLNVGWWLDERFDPYKSTLSAAEYLSKLHDQFDDWYLALAAYNAGEGRIQKALNSSGAEDFFDLSQKRKSISKRGRDQYLLPAETRNYVPRFIAVLKIVRHLEDLGFAAPDWNRGQAVAEVQAPPKTDLKELARTLGLPWSEFANYNPAFPDAGSHPTQASAVYVPVDLQDHAQAYLAGASCKEFTGYYSVYTVAKGDNLDKIARKFKIPADVLRRYNGDRASLKVGDKIKVPGRSETRMTASNLRDESGGKNSKAKAKDTKNLAQKRANYVVRTGDTLWTLAKQFNTSVATLAKANGLAPRADLELGQKLYIPDSDQASTDRSKEQAAETRQLITYKVKKGDTIFTVAKRFGVSPTSIQAWNDLGGDSDLKPGSRLKVYSR